MMRTANPGTPCKNIFSDIGGGCGVNIGINKEQNNYPFM
jgi:hypothetical protein